MGLFENGFSNSSTSNWYREVFITSSITMARFVHSIYPWDMYLTFCFFFTNYFHFIKKEVQIFWGKQQEKINSHTESFFQLMTDNQKFSGEKYNSWASDSELPCARNEIILFSPCPPIPAGRSCFNFLFLISLKSWSCFKIKISMVTFLFLTYLSEIKQEWGCIVLPQL